MIAVTIALAVLAQDPSQLARSYADAVETVNKAHADKPVAKEEVEIGKQLPAAAAKAIGQLVRLEDSPGTRDALLTAARAALELDRSGDFAALRERLASFDPRLADELGIAVSRPRFLAIGTGGITTEGLTELCDVLDLVLDAYHEVFGLVNFSKVPGKKLRLRVRLVEKITEPPHFAPQFPYHSEIDFPVVDPKSFMSPTKDGKFLFYGLCHELGHVIAMWGDTKNEEDRHAWAHYTGAAIVEYFEKNKKERPALDGVRDFRWRSLDFDRKKLEASKAKPGGKDVDSVMARFLALHDAVGPRVVGEALNALDAKDQHLLVNRVRYYSMKDLQKALLATNAGKDKEKKKAIEAAFAD